MEEGLWVIKGVLLGCTKPAEKADLKLRRIQNGSRALFKMFILIFKSGDLNFY